MDVLGSRFFQASRIGAGDGRTRIIDPLQFGRKPPGRRRGQGRRKTRCGLKLVRFLAISHSAPPEASYDAPASLPTPSPLGMTFFPSARELVRDERQDAQDRRLISRVIPLRGSGSPCPSDKKARTM